tara:strand:- start:3252 stop:4553 length:1302 start_codon:yes stop_codon:yes gene_type:complete
MKKILIIAIFLSFNTFNGQVNMPVDFENAQVTFEDFINFNGGAGYVVYNPQIDDENASESVGLIVRDGGDIWAGSYLELEDYLDFSTNTTINMRVLSPYPGLMVKFKIEGDQGSFPSEPATERDAYTTTTNQWEVLSWSFAGEPSNTYRKLVLMFDFGNIGDGTADSTFYFDDIYQTDPSGGLGQIDLPITYDDSSIYYSFIPFGDDSVEIELLETTSGNYGKVVKSNIAESWAGVTLSNETGLVNTIPVTSSNSKMYVHVNIENTSTTNIPIRLKIENSNDPTQSVETEAFTTVTNQWEVLEFNFNNEATGTAALNENYPFDMVSIFFNFGSSGDNQTVYNFDNISFGSPISLSTNSSILSSYKVYPNPFVNTINIFGIDGVETVVINDVLGKEIFKGVGVEEINLSSFEKGTYFLTLSKGNQSSTFKVIKK